MESLEIKYAKNLPQMGKTAKSLYSGYLQFFHPKVEKTFICRYLTFYWELNGARVLYLTTKTPHNLDLDSWKVSYEPQLSTNTLMLDLLTEKFQEKKLKIKGMSDIKSVQNNESIIIPHSNIILDASVKSSFYLVDASLNCIEV